MSKVLGLLLLGVAITFVGCKDADAQCRWTGNGWDCSNSQNSYSSGASYSAPAYAYGGPVRRLFGSRRASRHEQVSGASNGGYGGYGASNGGYGGYGGQVIYTSNPYAVSSEVQVQSEPESKVTFGASDTENSLITLLTKIVDTVAEHDARLDRIEENCECLRNAPAYNATTLKRAPAWNETKQLACAPAWHEPALLVAMK